MSHVDVEANEPDVAVTHLQVVKMLHAGVTQSKVQIAALASAGLPQAHEILARLTHDHVAEPAHTVDVVAVHVARAELGEVLQESRKGTLGVSPVVLLGQSYRLLHGWRVELPDLDRVIHAGGDHEGPGEVDVLQGGNAHATENVSMY